MKKVVILALAFLGAALVLGIASCSNGSDSPTPLVPPVTTPTTPATDNTDNGGSGGSEGGEQGGGGGSQQQTATTYTITVTSGTAKNAAGTVVTSAAAGDIITIVANAPEVGKAFDKWTSSTSGVTFVNEISASTTFTMPTGEVNVTANYKNLPPSTYSIAIAQDIVNGGVETDKNSAVAGESVVLTATPASGYQFSAWVVTAADGAAVTVTSNSFEMPEKNVIVSATFAAIPYAITVTSGTAKNAVGTVVTSAAVGDIITIVASAPASGKKFDKWTCSIAGVTLASETASTTTFIMPASVVSCAATYKSAIPADFVKIEGSTVVGSTKYAYDEYTKTEVFKKGRTVVIPSFWMCDHEVTQSEYFSVMGVNPSYFDGSSGKEVAEGESQDDRPVEQVNWYAAITYCNKRSLKEGFTPCYTVSGVDFNGNVSVPTSDNSTWNAASCDFSANGYRLPTDAEWEYAVIGGKNGVAADHPTSFPGTDDFLELGKYAWFKNNSDSRTHAVKIDKVPGTSSVNSLGLYDMSGNVYEWCWDFYNTHIDTTTSWTGPSEDSYASRRICRGGCYYDRELACVVYMRNCGKPYIGNIYNGLRLVCTATSD